MRVSGVKGGGGGGGGGGSRALVYGCAYLEYERSVYGAWRGEGEAVIERV